MYDYDDNTIRGSFVTICLTVFIALIIWWAVSNTEVMKRVKELSELIIGFYFTSVGLWKAGSVLKYNKDADVAVAKEEVKKK